MTKAPKKITRLISALTICLIVFTMMPATASAVTKSKTYTNVTMEASGAIKELGVYGKDKISFKYDGKKVISSSASQSSKNLGTKICEKGGIKCTEKKSTYHTYKSKWYLNLSVLPTWVGKLVKKITKVDISDLGRIATISTTYKINKTGTVSKSRSLNFYLPNKYKDKLSRIKTFVNENLL